MMSEPNKILCLHDQYMIIIWDRKCGVWTWLGHSQFGISNVYMILIVLIPINKVMVDDKIHELF